MRNELITPDEAYQTIMRFFPAVESEEVELLRALNRHSTSDWMADRDQPPFDRVMMDGLAIRYADYAMGQREWDIAGLQAAGHPVRSVTSDQQAFEIMTGAAMVHGLDTVIPYEELVVEDHRARYIGSLVKENQHVHRQGADVSAGQRVLVSGSRIGPAEIGIAASIGMHVVGVRKLPRAVVISTGDELVEVFAHPLPHQIRRSNVHAITAALMQSGIAVVDQRHISDTQAELAVQLNEVLQAYDLVILSGGVSMGKLDFVPDVLKDCGVEIHFHGIAQRPGKPMLFGTTDRARVFALPGNPVSSLVCWARYVKPFLEQSVEPIWINQAFEMNAGKLTRFIPVAQNNGRMDVIETNGSGDFMSLAGICGFVEVQPGEQQMPIALWPL